MPSFAVVLLALCLAALIALAALGARMAAQLRELQALWLKETRAQRDLHNENTKALEAKLDADIEALGKQTIQEERSLQQRVEKLSSSISSLSTELSETKQELRALPWRDDRARIQELTRRADEQSEAHAAAVAALEKNHRAAVTKLETDHRTTLSRLENEHRGAIAALEKEQRTALSAMEKLLTSAREIADTRGRDLAHAQGELSRIVAEMKAYEETARSTGAALEAMRGSLRDAEARAERFEKLLIDVSSAARLDKQLMERLSAAEERLNTLTDALRKTESELWTERTAKEAMGLEVRAVRDDMKRLSLKLNDETQRREALEKWSAEATVKLGEAVALSEATQASPGPESKILPPPPSVPAPSEMTAPAPSRALRASRQSQAALAAAAKKNQPEEPKRIASWWCSICGRGGTNMATTCKHEWKRNERGEMT